MALEGLAPRGTVGRRGLWRLGQLSRTDFVLRWAVLLAFMGLWQVLTLQADSPYFPPPTEIIGRVRDLWLSGPWQRLFLAPAVAEDIAPSLLRMFTGWGIAVLLGVGLGVLIGLSRSFADYVDPLIHFLRAIPPPALIPLLLVLLGLGDGMKVTLIVVGALFPVLLNAVDGVRSVDSTQLETGRIYGIDRRRRITSIVLPSAMPKIFAGLRISLAIALILMVISEMVAATNGIGFTIVSAQRSFRMLDMWAGIFVLGFLGYVFNGVLLRVEAHVLAWHRGARQGAQ